MLLLYFIKIKIPLVYSSGLINCTRTEIHEPGLHKTTGDGCSLEEILTWSWEKTDFFLRHLFEFREGISKLTEEVLQSVCEIPLGFFWNSEYKFSTAGVWTGNVMLSPSAVRVSSHFLSMKLNLSVPIYLRIKYMGQINRRLWTNRILVQPH